VFQEQTVALPSGQAIMSQTAHSEYSQTPGYTDDFDFDWASDSDYLTSQSADPETQWSTPVAYSSRDSSLSRSEPFASPSDVECVEIISSSRSEASRGVQPALSRSIPQPPFKTPPKLRTVEQVMRNYSGTDLFALRKLTTALAREAIFGRKALVKLSLSGRSDSELPDPHYIKTLVHSRVPNKSDVDFEETWKICQSLSKSCQTLRSSAKKKLI
jgi:hypothetical protein